MSVTLFFGIRLSDRPYERIAHKLNEDAFSTYKVENLKKVLIGELLGKEFPTASRLELVYCGSVLDDSVELGKEGVQPGSTIHVFEKNENQPAEPFELNDDAIRAASSAYRSVCFSCSSKTFPKVVRPEVINKVLEKYPEFYNDTGAYAILRDAVLLEKMITSPQAKQIGEQYPLLISSAKFVAETMIKHLPPQTTAAGDSSDSASDQDSPQASPNHSDNQRISRGQLAAALLSAGTAALNARSNTQRRTDDEEMATTSSTTSPNPGISSVESSGNSQQYAAELQTMRDMGLMEENSNLQALIICNGNIAAAVTLVLGGNFA